MFFFRTKVAAWCAIAAVAVAGITGCASSATPTTTASADVPAVNDTTKFTDIPAAQIAAALSPGWNLGNQLEGVKIVTDIATGTSKTFPSETGYAATRISNELLANVKAAGFKFVRIPVSYFAFIDDANGYKIDEAWLARIKEVVDMCVANGLYCMINMHGDGYTSIKNAWLLCAAPDQKPILEKYTAIWKQIASTFKDYDESVIFESMNEEFDGSYSGINEAAYENINAYNEAFVKTVRASGGNNAKRWLLLAGWNTNIDQTCDGFGTKGHFRLPKDSRLMVSVHYYDPWGFCGGENGNATQWGSFAARPDKANGSEVSMAKQFNKIRDTFTAKGIPVVVGEWGSIDKTEDDPDSKVYRAYFAQKLCENAKRVGAVPVYWDNAWNGKYGFGIFNRGEKADDLGNIKPGTVQVSQPGIIAAIMGVYATPNASGSTSKAKLLFTTESLTLQPSETATLTAKVLGGTDADKVRWQSSDETVAVVYGGKVLATGAGTAEITASLPNGKSGKCAVTVALTDGVQAKLYLFEGLGWSAVKSAPIIIKAGTESEYEVSFNASSLCLNNIAAMYLKDVEVEENHATASTIASCPITVTEVIVNGVSIPLINNENVEAVNGKKQFDMPIINEWATQAEMIGGFPPSGHRNLGNAVPTLKIDKDKNLVTVKFKTLASGAAVGKAAAAADPAKPQLDAAKTYHAYFGLQAADSWVFRNSYGNNSYGHGTKEFEGGLYDTENGILTDGHVQGKITDATITKADIEAKKTFTVTCTDFNLNDSKVKASALNCAMVSTDIPYGTVEVTDAKLYFDGKQVNLTAEGKSIFVTDMDNGYVLVTFLNIWQTTLKTFGYSMPTQSIKMELTLKLK
jgi:endoglucanase